MGATPLYARARIVMECAASISGSYSSPLGPISVVANQRGVCRVEMCFGKQCEGGEGESKASSSAQSCGGTSQCTEAAKNLNACLKWLDSYFDGDEDGMKTHMPQLDLPRQGLTLGLTLDKVLL